MLPRRLDTIDVLKLVFAIRFSTLFSTSDCVNDSEVALVEPPLM